MARVFITGSTDGLGRLAAELLIGQGHDVVLHARNAQRADTARAGISGTAGVVTGDLSSISQTRSVAEQVDAFGPFAAVIHNAGVYSGGKVETEDGLPHIFAINTLAPYILTALIQRPQRLIYLSSGMHQDAGSTLTDLLWRQRRWNGTLAYSESKLHDVLLAFAVARLWPGVFSNAVNPGWVPTRMGGANAPDNLQDGCRTQAWLAVSNDPHALVSGEYFFHQRVQEPHRAARNVELQDRLLAECARICGIVMP